jgi:hypothetical protein
MAPTKNPDHDPPEIPHVYRKEWSADQGTQHTSEWEGTPDDMKQKFVDLSAVAAAGGNNINQLSYENARGRARVMARFSSSGQSTPDFPDNVTVVEELYAIDVIRDITESDYFSQTITAPAWMVAKQNAIAKGLPLSDEAIAFVRAVSEIRASEAGIDKYADQNDFADDPYHWENWTTGMKELRFHLLRGAESYYETAFVLRQSLHGIKKAQMGVTFTGINLIDQGVLSFATDMADLLDELPEGEWIQKSPQAEHLGQGRWRVTKEWHYAKKWSIVYGGSWNYEAP